MADRNGKRAKSARTITRRLFFSFIVLLFAPLIGSAVVNGSNRVHWSEATHDPTGQAPDPALTKEAVVQVYAARAFGWRGAFGVHTWIALKPAGAADYTRLEVFGWAVRRGGKAVRVGNGGPDNQWYGAHPELLADHRGETAEKMIPRILEAAERYPYPDSYRVWPGPNSNTFTAFVAREVPELRLELSPLAVGKDYLPDGGIVGAAPSGTGYQLSLFGLAGMLLAVDEGVEVHVLGLTLGLDPKDVAIKLPGIGTLSPLGTGR